MNILEIKKIKKRFNNRIAVDDISFEIKSGETFGLIGESGCGKTTLARMIMKLISRDAGEIIFDGKSIDDHKNSEYRKRMQIIFQEPLSALNPKISVGESLIEPFLIHNICGKKEAVERGKMLLAKIGLNANYFNRYPNEISGGECQRACIARSIALNPKLLILDEPVSSLDLDIQKQIIELLTGLKSEYNMTYLFITHDLYLAKNICDRVGVMKDGKIVEIGNTDEIFNDPKDSYTRKLIDNTL